MTILRVWDFSHTYNERCRQQAGVGMVTKGTGAVIGHLTCCLTKHQTNAAAEEFIFVGIENAVYGEEGALVG